MKFKNITHWVLFILLLGIVFTAVMNTTFFSKAAIIDSFTFSFPMVDLYDIGFAQKLFIARMERRTGWEWHFWMGAIFGTILLLRVMWHLFKREKINAFQGLIYISGLTLFATGIPLFIRAFIDISMEIQNFARAIHFYTAWFFGVSILIHIAHVIYKENKIKDGVISSKFKFGPSLVIAFALTSFLNTSSFANDDYYKEALLYMKGEKGTKTIELTIPNCPYDNCKRAEDDNLKNKEHIDLDNNTRIYKLKKVDYVSVLKLLTLSYNKYGNIQALEQKARILFKNVNYRDKQIDPVLREKVETEFGIKIEDLINDAKNTLEILASKKNCYGSFKLAEAYEKGLLGYQKSKAKAKELYFQTAQSCSKNKIEYIISKGKLK